MPVPIALHVSSAIGDHRAVTREHRHHDHEAAGRERQGAPQTETPHGSDGARELVQSLQQRAGNAAVAALMSGGRSGTTAIGAPAVGGAPAGVQRAPKLGAGDELMSPDGNTVPLQASGGGGGGAGGQKAAAPSPGPGSAEAQVFERTLLDPLRALYACVRDPSPDYDLAMQHVNNVGKTLNDYFNRYTESDPGTAEGFMSALGWLSRVRDVLRRRLGQGREMSDADLATNVVAVLDGLKQLQGRLP